MKFQKQHMTQNSKTNNMRGFFFVQNKLLKVVMGFLAVRDTQFPKESTSGNVLFKTGSS